MTEKKDYTNFDRFIKAKIRDKTLYVGMSETKLKEELKNLGIHRVKTHADDGRDYTNNHYPTKKQTDRVVDIINQSQPRQERIDKSIFYSRETKRKGSYYHAKDIIYYNDKVYRKGQFLPKRYIDE